MEIRFPKYGNQRSSTFVGVGEIFSFADMDGESLALVQMPDRTIVTARVPRELQCPEIGMTVEVVHNPVHASEGFLISATV
jgi:uncharacterized OB-fold protein